MYLGAKTTVHAIVGVVQILALLVTLRAVSGSFLREVMIKDLRASSGVWLFLVLMGCYLGGVGIGLFVSALVRTEEAAVAALPLLIMPQLLISAVGTMTQNALYTDARPFRPLVVTMVSDKKPDRPATFIDLLSMACLSRPAVLVAEAREVKGYHGAIWLADLCHLIILLLGIGPWWFSCSSAL